MSGFIQDFVNGKLDPQRRHWKDLLERDKVLTAMDDNEAYLQENLDGEAKNHLLAYIAAWDKNLEDVDDAAFIAGFRLGARCMMDVLKE